MEKWPKWNQDKTNFANCSTHKRISFLERLQWKSDSSSTDVSWCQIFWQETFPSPFFLNHSCRWAGEGCKGNVQMLPFHNQSCPHIRSRWRTSAEGGTLSLKMKRSERCTASSVGARKQAQEQLIQGQKRWLWRRRIQERIQAIQRSSPALSTWISDGMLHFFLSPTWSKSSSFWCGHLAAMELRNHSSASACIQMLSDFQWSPLHHPPARSDTRASQKNLAKYMLAFPPSH